MCSRVREPASESEFTTASSALPSPALTQTPSLAASLVSLRLRHGSVSPCLLCAQVELRRRVALHSPVLNIVLVFAIHLVSGFKISN